MRARLTGALLVAVAMAAGSAGCGDSGGSDSISTTIATASITKAAFVGKANAICKQGTAHLLKEVSAYQEHHINVVSRKLLPDTIRAVIRPEIASEIKQMTALGAPPGDAPEIEEFFSTLLSELNEIIAKEATTFDEAEGMLLSAGDIARRYGLDECRYVLVKPS